MTVNEKIEVSVSIIRSLMRLHGFDDWDLEVNRTRRTMATTWYGLKKITFSKYFLINATREEIEGIALHEIAHAIVGPGYDHGPFWQDICKMISPTNEYAKSHIKQSINKYNLTCPHCGAKGQLNKKSNRYCAECFSRGEITKMDISENILEVKEL